ncbi:MAG: DUF2299 family protein [Nitrospiraceae bacterium]
MQKTLFEEVLVNGLVLMFGEFMATGVFVEALLSIWIAYRLWRHLKKEDRKMPVLSRVATITSITFGLFTLASFLAIQVHLNGYAASVEKERQEAETQRIERERLSPKYTKETVRDWLDKSGYSTREVSSEKEMEFRLDVTSGDFNFAVYQAKATPDVLAVDTRVILKPHIRDLLTKMTPQRRNAFLNDVKLELIKSGMEVGMLAQFNDKELTEHHVDLHNQFIFDPDKRQTFMREVFRVKAAKAMLDLYYEKIKL